MSAEDQISLCHDWVRRGAFAEIDKGDFEDMSFEECQQIDKDYNGGAGSGGRLSGRGGSDVFTWWTFIFVIIALFIPITVVAIYTNFTFKWQKKKVAQTKK